MNHCPSCGRQAGAQARFCPACGTRLTSSSLTGQLSPQTMLHGRYVVVRLVARGGMGAVYQASDTQQPGTLWAIKEMGFSSVTSADQAQALAAFQREANLLLNLRHPSIPRALDLFEERGRHYLIMAFIDGDTLAQRLQRAKGPLPVPDVLRWAVQLCDVLSHLHSQRPPIIYRDLKPANIMVDRQDRVQLIDFGIARFQRVGRTRDTVMQGTEEYASPEHYGQGQTEARSDLYCLGATLYHLLTGQAPATVTERLLPPPTGVPLVPPRQLNTGIPLHLEAAILRAMDLRLEGRFGRGDVPESAMAEMKAALQGQPIAQPRTKACPHCGKENLLASLACFSCGYDFQSGRPPAPTQKHPVPQPPLAGPTTPYQLSRGHEAAGPADLPAVCDADWARAVEQFHKGYMARWLRSAIEPLRTAGRYGEADDWEAAAARAESIVQKAQLGDVLDRSVALEEFLESLGAPTPLLEVVPLDLDMGSIGQGELSSTATLTLTNRGRGFLSGQVTPKEPWLQVYGQRVGCLAGQSCAVQIVATADKLPGGTTQTREGLRVQTNGGDRPISARLQVLPPVLEVTPVCLDFGGLNQGATSAPMTLTITNRGRGSLTGSVANMVGWIRISPDRFTCAAGQSCAVQLTAVPGGRPAGVENRTDALLVQSNAGCQSLAARIEVLSPKLQVTPARLILDQVEWGRQGALGHADLSVRNSGTGQLIGTASADSWLSVSPSNVSVAPSVAETLRVSMVALPSVGSGEHTGTLHLATNGGTADVTVQVQVPPLPRTASGLVIASAENLALFLEMAAPPDRIWWEQAEMEMCLVLAGPFGMGSDSSDPSSERDERPRHIVSLDAYYIGRYPVTEAQYSLFSGKAPPPGTESLPAVHVSWDDALAYCQWAGLRLPTEAEWEKAARGADGRIYPWGSKWQPSCCNWGRTVPFARTPVGAHSPQGDSPCGCADMAGNVWEWCADWYGGAYDRAVPTSSPEGLSFGQMKVVRGGCFSVGPDAVRAAQRYAARPTFRARNIGLRCVAELRG